MSREFKEVVEVTTVTDEYYRFLVNGMVARLEEIRTIRSQRSLEGDYTTLYMMVFAGQDFQKAIYGSEFLGGQYEKIPHEWYLAYFKNYGLDGG